MATKSHQKLLREASHAEGGAAPTPKPPVNDIIRTDVGMAYAKRLT